MLRTVLVKLLQLQSNKTSTHANMEISTSGVILHSLHQDINIISTRLGSCLKVTMGMQTVCRIYPPSTTAVQQIVIDEQEVAIGVTIYINCNPPGDFMDWRCLNIFYYGGSAIVSPESKMLRHMLNIYTEKRQPSFVWRLLPRTSSKYRYSEIQVKQLPIFQVMLIDSQWGLQWIVYVPSQQVALTSFGMHVSEHTQGVSVINDYWPDMVIGLHPLHGIQHTCKILSTQDRYQENMKLSLRVQGWGERTWLCCAEYRFWPLSGTLGDCRIWKYNSIASSCSQNVNSWPLSESFFVLYTPHSVLQVPHYIHQDEIRNTLGSNAPLL